MKVLPIITAAAAVASLTTMGVALAASPTPYAKVTSVKVASVTSSGATVSWAKDSAASGTTIRVLVYNASSSAKAFDASVAGTSVSENVTGLQPGTAYDVEVNVNGNSAHSSSGWTTPIQFFTQASSGGTGGTGPQGPPGPQGPAGPQGPSGVVAASADDMGAIASVPTGGPFVANSTQVGTLTLAAGTYLISISAKATPPSGGTGAVSVFPEFFLYDQVKNSGFTGDLMNVGSGALESGTNANIDSYFSGSQLVTLTANTTLYVYAFGYDSDRGAGTYVLDDLTVSHVQLQPAT